MSFIGKLFGRHAQAAVPAAPPPAAATPPSAELPPPSGSVIFPLKAITDLFPESMADVLRKPVSEHVRVWFPRELILPQLAGGAVRVSYAQLLATAPPVFFHANAVPEETQIELPLEPALRQLPYSRRDDQRIPAAPASIPSIFQKTAPRNGDAAAEAWYTQRRTEVAPGPIQAREPGVPCIEVPIEEVSPGLPQGVFRIPLTEIESRLPTGRALFEWARLQVWASVPLDVPAGQAEVPLQALVPRFLAVRQKSDARKPAEIDARIPDLFAPARAASRAAQPITPPATEAPAPALPLPVAAPVAGTPIATPIPAAPSAQRSETPARIIEQLRSLGGIQGAFIATNDGLLVAGDTPSANGNVLAAFAPTVFAQLTKYADMAQLGAPESIDIMVGSGTAIHVRRAGKLYVGILRPAAHPLPNEQLCALTGALQSN